jgi:hypothetical protein
MNFLPAIFAWAVWGRIFDGGWIRIFSIIGESLRFLCFFFFL